MLKDMLHNLLVRHWQWYSDLVAIQHWRNASDEEVIEACRYNRQFITEWLETWDGYDTPTNTKLYKAALAASRELRKFITHEMMIREIPSYKGDPQNDRN